MTSHPSPDRVTADFLRWVNEFSDYALRANTARPPLGELRRLHRHRLSVPEAFVYWHYRQPAPRAHRPS